MNGLLGFFSDKDSQKAMKNGLLDAANRGMVASTLGGPVDLATTVANLGIAGAGYLGHKAGLLDRPPELINPLSVPGSSEWIGQKMQNAGMVSPNRNALAEAGMGLLSPVAFKGAQKVGGLLYNVEQNALANASKPSTMRMQGQRGAVGFSYPQDEAMRIAQRNAAKPVSEGGLGLGPNNTAMERAEALGFDTSYPMYHGGAPGINAFDESYFGRTTGAESAKMGVFTTDNADQATQYARAASERELFEKFIQENSIGDKWKRIANTIGVKANIPVEQRVDILRQNASAARVDPMSEAASALRGGNVPSPLGGETVYKVLTRYDNPKVMNYDEAVRKYKNMPGIIDSARKEGNPHIVLDGVDEGPYNALWDVHFNPANIRSVNAAFDPAKINEPDLLGRATVGNLLGLAGLSGASVFGLDPIKKKKN